MPNAGIQVLNDFGFMAVDNDEPIRVIGSEQPLIEGETFSGWKMRLFGTPLANIAIYRQYTPAQNTRIATIMRNSEGAKIKLVLDDHVAKSHEAFKAEYYDMLLLMINSIVVDNEDVLEKSVVDHFNRFIDTGRKHHSARVLLEGLILNYNVVVKKYGESRASKPSE